MNPHQYRHLPTHLADRLWKLRVALANSRAREYGCHGVLTTDDWLAVLEAFGGLCSLCGSDEYLTMDHIVPLCEGGENTPDNLRPLCRDCHLDKSAYERMGLVRRKAIYGENNPFLPQKGV